MIELVNINYFTTRITITAHLIDGWVKVWYDVEPDDAMIFVNEEHAFDNNYVKCGFMRISKFIALRNQHGLRCDNVK